MNIRLLLNILLFCLIFNAGSQTNFAYVFKDLTVEKPCGMVNYSNSSFIITANHNFYDVFNFNLYKIDHSGNLLFKKNVQTAYGNVNNYYPLNHLIKCIPTPNKGIFSLHKVNTCFNPNYKSFISGVAYNLFDSLGNNLCGSNTFFPSNTDRFRDIGIISNHFFYVCTSFSMSLISNTTGSISPTPFYVSADSIINTHAFHHKRILICSENKLSVIDTMGNPVKQVATSLKYRMIKNKNNHYYAYSPSIKTLHKLDTNLTVLKTFTLTNTQQIQSFDFDNDSLLVSVFDNSTQKSTIHLLNSDLTILNSFLIDKTGEFVTQIYKQGKYFVLSAEQTANDQQPLPYTQHAYTGCFETVNTLDSISYTNDLNITSINNSGSQYISYLNTYNAYQMNYSNKITIYNNSSDTVKQFRIYESIDKILGAYMGTSMPNNCFGNSRTKIFQQTFTTTINPYSNAIVTFSGANVFTSLQNINFCYYVSIPNDKFEKSITNSSLCNTISLSLANSNSEYAIYPNPASTMITVLHDTLVEELTICDIHGKQLLTSSEDMIDISQLKSGVYFLKIKKNNEYTTKKVIKIE